MPFPVSHMAKDAPGYRKGFRRRSPAAPALAVLAVIVTCALLIPGAPARGAKAGPGAAFQRGPGVTPAGRGLAGRKILGLFSRNVITNLGTKYPPSQRPSVRNLRLFAKWMNVQPRGRGRFEWEKLDAQVDGALGIGVNSIMLTITGPVPAWARSRSGPKPLYLAPPRDMNDWAAFCGAVAKRYRGYVDLYQVWQEPGWDLNSQAARQGIVYYSSSCDYTYLGMMRAGYGAVKARDPGAYVCTGSMIKGLTHSAGDLDYYRVLLSGGNQDVSMKVTSGRDIVAERPIYFDYHGNTPGGNVELGTRKPGKTWYLAEGTTIRGFEEWICIQNPGNGDTTARITYMFPGGTTRMQSVVVRAHSRSTISVNDAVGPEKDVSAMVEAGRDIVVERPMYFNYHDKWTGGSIGAGVTGFSRTWYLAEGATHDGFEEWISLMNPSSSPADVTVRYLFNDGGTVEQRIAMAPTSRETVDVNLAVGPNRDVSALVESDQPIIAERPMYFNYHGAWPGGHTQVGSCEPHTTWLFAEGTTRKTANEGSFEEWLSIMNPGDCAAEVELTYMFGGGLTRAGHRTVAPRSRETVLVNDEVGNDRDVSVRLSSTQPVIAERPMYYDYHGSIAGGDVEMGRHGGAREWYFAEGTTREGFEEWLTLMNPTPEADTATITYMFADGTLQDERVSLPAHSRTTVGINRSLSVANVCDGIAIHPYDRPDFWAWYYKGLVDLCAREGFPGKEVVVTEIGWPHAPGAGYSPEGQRQAIGEVGIGSLWNAGCRKIWVFEDCDPAKAWDNIYEGLYYYDGTALPAWSEYKNWQQQLPDYGNKPKSLFH